MERKEEGKREKMNAIFQGPSTLDTIAVTIQGRA